VTYRIFVRLFLTSTALAIALGASGCARHAVEAPPEPATPAPVTTLPVVEVTATPIEPPPPPPAPPNISPAFFGFDSWALEPAARKALDEAAGILREHAELDVVIEGHCDERGSLEYNMALGQKRASAARNYLVDAGVAKERIRIVSYGEAQPFQSGHDEAAWALNRRAQFVLPRIELGETAGGSDPD